MLLQKYAFTVLALFYGCYFIKMIKQKWHGINTNQLGKQKTGITRVIEAAVQIAAMLTPAAEIASIIINVSPLPAWAKLYGVGISGIGVAVFITAVVTMKNNWRAGVSKTEKTSLVTNGIFKYSRNPAFLGFDLVYIGILLMFFNWVLFAVTVLAVIAFHLQIVIVEEKHLTSTFGKDYIKYKSTVNRYIGQKLFAKEKPDND